MPRILPLAMLPALMLTGAIFGFFYAWVCSTMWGLDALPPDIAIAAMQGMNASVRNVVFAPAFFGTGPVLMLTGVWLWSAGSRGSAVLMLLASVVYVLGAMLPTLLVNVPLNEALAQVDPSATDAAAIWGRFSAEWQAWNVSRTIFSGVALALAVWAVATVANQKIASPKVARAM
jgi:uncharacterized membrane protein